MKTEALHNTAYYTGLPYTLVLKKDDEGEYVGRVEELHGCVAHGATEIEAIESLKRMQELWIEDCLEAGDTVPLPKDDEDLPSGKWVQRVPRSLHKRLSEKARTEGVSLNQFVMSVLSEAVSDKAVSTKAIEELMAQSLVACIGSAGAVKAISHADWTQPGDWRLLGPACTSTELLPQMAHGVISGIILKTRTLLNDDEKQVPHARYHCHG